MLLVLSCINDMLHVCIYQSVKTADIKVLDKLNARGGLNAGTPVLLYKFTTRSLRSKRLLLQEDMRGALDG